MSKDKSYLSKTDIIKYIKQQEGLRNKLKSMSADRMERKQNIENALKQINKRVAARSLNAQTLRKVLEGRGR